MREIKFRGKRTDTKDWVFGSFIYARRTNVNTDKTGEYKSIIQDDSNLPYQVISKTVSQFTGLKDKNGKEIYEGDEILVEGFASYIFDDIRKASTLEPYCNKNQCEVIGNIYEKENEVKNETRQC